MKLLAALFVLFWLSACAPTNVTTTDGGLSREQIRIVVEFVDWFYEPADVPRWGELATEANKVAQPARGETSYSLKCSMPIHRPLYLMRWLGRVQPSYQDHDLRVGQVFAFMWTRLTLYLRRVLWSLEVIGSMKKVRDGARTS
jgi:hypothetical protein